MLRGVPLLNVNIFQDLTILFEYDEEKTGSDLYAKNILFRLLQ